jgi:hypothetical protein
MLYTTAKVKLRTEAFTGHNQRYKGKRIKLFLCLIKNIMKMYEEVEVYLNTFLISARDGGEQSASYPGHFTPGTQWTGGWICPRASQNIIMLIKNPWACQELNSVIQHSLIIILSHPISEL